VANERIAELDQQLQECEAKGFILTNDIPRLIERQGALLTELNNLPEWKRDTRKGVLSIDMKAQHNMISYFMLVLLYEGSR